MTAVEQLADPAWALLDGLSNVNTYDAEVPGQPPTDADGRVHAYAVYYPSPGWLHAISLNADLDSLDWRFQVTAVGGDRVRALGCVGRVRSVLTGAWLTVAGQELQIREDFDPGPVQRDPNLSPPRFYVPLQFAVFAP